MLSVQFNYLKQHLLTVNKKYFTVGLSFLIYEMGKLRGIYASEDSFGLEFL